MIPLFTFPLAFAALAAVPALLAIYWLRNRFRRHAVSSLMLWVDARQPREGGARVERLQIPLLLLLELLVLILLIIAATDPRVLIGYASRPLLIVLDDSYSMLAGGDDNARSRGIDAVRATLARHPGYTTHLVLAGPTPQTLGDATKSTRQTINQLKGWQCRGAYADLPKSIAFAAELGGDDAHILVITDHAPPADLQAGRTQWQAMGRPLDNLAIINAVRSPGDGGERCLLEIANDSPTAAIARLEISTGADSAQRSSIQLAPNATHRITFDVPPGVDVLSARLLNVDALELDNHIALLPQPHRPVQVTVMVDDAKLSAAVDKGLASTGRAKFGALRPELLITTDRQVSATADTWTLTFVRDAEAASFVGPFVIDRSHPLTQGLSLSGAVWGAGQKDELPGLPIVTVGNTSLMTDYQRLSGSHEIHMRFAPELSTLQDSANWPIWFWNLLEWRSEHLPGLRRPNVRLGAETSLTLATDVNEVRITEPDGKSYALPVRDRRMLLHPQAVGIHQISAGATDGAAGVTYRVSVNALSADESDLSACRAETWGDWLDEQTLQREYQSIAWVFVLLALAALAVHQWLIARSSAAAGSPLPGARAGVRV